MPDSTVIAQKIMSAVVRTGQRFGAAYVCDVLTAAANEKIMERGHDQQSTYGLMREENPRTLMAWTDQLVDQGLLEREGEFRVIKVTPAGWRILRSQAEARLLPVVSNGKAKGGETRARPRRNPGGEPTSPNRRRAGSAPVTDDVAQTTNPRPANVSPGPLDADEKELFEKLRALRRTIADEINMPAFVVFSDKTLRELARAKPKDESAMLAVKGVGPAKFDAYGTMFLKVIREHEVT
jgi:ATP-dependent DNA helicase RecQ